MASRALTIRFVQTWLSSPAYAGTCGRLRSYSFTTVTPGGILALSMTSVASSPACRSVGWCGIRSICEYCLAASTRAEIRLVLSAISTSSVSASTV
jgi:hypothetical protein